MKTLSAFIVMLFMAFTTFANTPEDAILRAGKLEIKEISDVKYLAFSFNPETKECLVSMSASIVVGSVQCTINVTATGSNCAEATTSAISQLGDAKKAIQEALQ